MVSDRKTEAGRPQAELEVFWNSPCMPLPNSSKSPIASNRYKVQWWWRLVIQMYSGMCDLILLIDNMMFVFWCIFAALCLKFTCSSPFCTLPRPSRVTEALAFYGMAMGPHDTGSSKGVGHSDRVATPMNYLWWYMFSHVPDSCWFIMYTYAICLWSYVLCIHCICMQSICWWQTTELLPQPQGAPVKTYAMIGSKSCDGFPCNLMNLQFSSR